MTTLCVNCKHSTRSTVFLIPIGEYRCVSPNNFEPGCDPVTGKQKRIWVLCATMRSKDQPCGPDGKWFERKVA